MALAGGALFALLVLVGLDRLTGGWTRNRLPAIGGLLLAGLAAPGPSPGTGIWPWALMGLAAGAGLLVLYRVTRGLHLAFVPAMAATVLALDALREASFAAYSAAPLSRLLAAAVLLTLAWAWSRFLFRDEPRAAPAPASP